MTSSGIIERMGCHLPKFPSKQNCNVKLIPTLIARNMFNTLHISTRHRNNKYMMYKYVFIYLFSLSDQATWRPFSFQMHWISDYFGIGCNSATGATEGRRSRKEIFEGYDFTKNCVDFVWICTEKLGFVPFFSFFSWICGVNICWTEGQCPRTVQSIWIS